jgi:hypothetical protein
MHYAADHGDNEVGVRMLRSAATSNAKEQKEKRAHENAQIDPSVDPLPSGTLPVRPYPNWKKLQKLLKNTNRLRLFKV